MIEDDAKLLKADLTPQTWKAGLTLMLVLGLYYGALQNGQWVPISDADLYIAISRNLALGRGFTFNGLPVQAIPPGWPLLLSGAMRISTSFRFLNLVPMCLMLGALLVFHRVLLRLTTPRRAFIICLIVGVISPVYRRTFLQHTEGLFCLLGAAAVLVAMHLNEGRRASWRVPLLLGLCAAVIFVRWPGVLLGPLIVGALLSGRLRPRWNRLWVCAALVSVLMLGVFFTLRWGLGARTDPQSWASETVTYAAREHGIAARLQTFHRRLPDGGVWFCRLLAEPASLGTSLRPVWVLSNLAGWPLWILFALGLVARLRRRRWVVAGGAAYAFVFIGFWASPHARYIVPVAPFLILGLLEGVDRLGQFGSDGSWRKAAGVITVGLYAAIAMANIPLWAVDAYVLHSDDFYGAYLAGQARALIGIARYLNEQGVADGEVGRPAIPRVFTGVSPTLGRLFDERGLVLLLDRSIVVVPIRLVPDGPDEELASWAREHGVKYYIHRPPISPWRVWHFRVPWLQEWVAGEPVTQRNPYYELYDVTGERPRKLDVPPWEGRVARVPHMSGATRRSVRTGPRSRP